MKKNEFRRAFFSSLSYIILSSDQKYHFEAFGRYTIDADARKDNNEIMNYNKTNNQTLAPEQQTKLLECLENRFEKNLNRHRGLAWTQVLEKLKNNPEKLWSLNEMEMTGGEPDVVRLDQKSNEIIFVDCSPESPANRRNFCYDREALESRKAHKPKNSAIDLAESIGIEILTEDQYRALQKIDRFDLKTSSWLATPPEIRKHGGAIFADRRYDHVFIYHNGADSYYAARGFRGSLVI